VDSEHSEPSANQGMLYPSELNGMFQMPPVDFRLNGLDHELDPDDFDMNWNHVTREQSTVISSFN